MGELARKPGCPKLPETPLELLTPRPGEGYSTFDRLLWPVFGVTGACLLVAFRNVVFRRPVWSGLPIYVMSGGVGYLASTMLRDMMFASKAEDDAVLRHYVTLHPEDFPPFERKRWRDVYQPFSPVR